MLVSTTSWPQAAGASSPWAPTTITRRVCPTPSTALTDIEFEQQTIIYDRTGKIELARLGELKRELVTFDQLPGEIIDATTAIEDKDFWSNAGFDPIGIVSAGLDTSRAGRAGPRRSPSSSCGPASSRPRRSRARPTSARRARSSSRSASPRRYPGDAGKQQIITAYLNQNFYGNQSYGVKAAAKGYFGKSMDRS